MNTEKSHEHSGSARQIALAALGVVFGDIGTSPIYTFRECFNSEHGLPASEANVFGILSTMFWSLIIIVTLKYVVLLLRADNKGEGGMLAMTALALRTAEHRWVRTIVIVLGCAGAALFYGDSMITPAISVLSAVEGIKVVTPIFDDYVVYIALAILTCLFLVQRQGTAQVGRLFGPVMLIWFAVLSLLGLMEIAREPRILIALNPMWIVGLLQNNGWAAFVVFASVTLVFTGAEALYADMGHFGRTPIQRAWLWLVMPALTLNYLGQGALVLAQPAALENPFFLLAPDWGLLPLVILACSATVIASQAVISGAFSLSQQAMQLGYLPRLDIRQTSHEAQGQIYVPQINWMLFVAVIVLVVSFQSSGALAHAYGFAVTGALVVDTLLFWVVVRGLWNWKLLPSIAVVGSLLAVEMVFFGANALKIPSGGWFPLAIGIAIYLLMSTWRRGREMVARSLGEGATQLESFLESLYGQCIARVPGTAVYLSPDANSAPVALLYNIRHNKVLHENIVLLTVETLDQPRADGHRQQIEQLGHGFTRMILRFGFAERPNVPLQLARGKAAKLAIDREDLTYFLGNATIIPSPGPGMALWRERLFVMLFRVQTRPTDFYSIPVDRVIELGVQIEI
ncbi:potassium transporter Kup [Roseiterribacter gracilis]|uniref:Probable potassium transport system protein Kup n=1 Tax=Roseiterribacter gracilis TaxID=2812848 RepID=A0A8S8XE47_9PROT|nr:putative potassium transport system protein kup 1 [Rhodospirillales bacterium TMPK1]